MMQNRIDEIRKSLLYGLIAFAIGLLAAVLMKSEFVHEFSNPDVNRIVSYLFVAAMAGGVVLSIRAVSGEIYKGSSHFNPLYRLRTFRYFYGFMFLLAPLTFFVMSIILLCELSKLNKELNFPSEAQ